ERRQDQQQKADRKSRELEGSETEELEEGLAPGPAIHAAERDREIDEETEHAERGERPGDGGGHPGSVEDDQRRQAEKDEGVVVQGEDQMIQIVPAPPVEKTEKQGERRKEQEKHPWQTVEHGGPESPWIRLSPHARHLKLAVEDREALGQREGHLSTASWSPGGRVGSAERPPAHDGDVRTGEQSQQAEKEDAGEQVGLERRNETDPAAREIGLCQLAGPHQERAQGAQEPGVEAEDLTQEIQGQPPHRGMQLAVLLPAARAEFPGQLLAAIEAGTAWGAICPDWRSE